MSEGQKHRMVDINIMAAMVAHEVNRVFCEYLKDDSQSKWEDAPVWQIESALMGVDVIRNNQDITPAQQHSCWMAVKKKDGWSYGEEKDETKKTHPCLVPYNELPEDQKFKDTLFGTAVRAVLNAPGIDMDELTENKDA